MEEWIEFLREGVLQASAAKEAIVDSLKERIAELEAQLHRHAH